MENFALSIDVRTLEKGRKKDIILNQFKELKPGQTLELINDHDPKPLYQQFLLNFPEQFQWTYLEEGPEVWKIAIARK